MEISSRQQSPDQGAHLRRLIYWYSLFSLGVVTALTLRCIFSQQTAKSDQAARMRRLVWVFAVLMGRIARAPPLLFIFSKRQQIRLRGCVGSHGYLLFSWGVATAPTLWCIFSNTAKSRSGRADAQRLIRIFALIM